ncbi:hypothetical protein ABB37_06772 [Leptomonas pyrrhocoris]|uniref:Uncharacterized protein n=1 Tax=Leptomonas pyrrhocoris TaxID=157538 RepID=A0A0M9FXL2_LEPPY|nr:hypothetical protein ABB37_06772 [Leptomonas pyrrhocoris]KPA78017.1 hypothetical protein ABB37_06772 [Leptomonas pyrrhocoris]|eukprot:XP_015656456.1 hypothetical protein ABB37_06772 [Leptomonas pyrrhocoris]
MGCTNQKLHMQQIAYQRDFLGACWNSSLGEEEAEEYLASRWMGVSKNVMALYTNNHCFTVRTLNKDEKARADAAAAGNPQMKAADAPAGGLAPGFGGDAGGGGGKTSIPLSVLTDSPSTSTVGKPSTLSTNTISVFSPSPESKQSREMLASPEGRVASPTLPGQLAAASNPAMAPPTTTTTAVRQSAGHAHGVSNNSVASVKDDHGAANAAAAHAAAGRATTTEKVKKSADPAALRNVVKDSMESERVVHADHPYLQRHGLSVYGGVVFRCAPAHRLYHRISLVPEANMKRLYDMQVTAMSRSAVFDAASSMIGRPGGGPSEPPHHFQPSGSSSDYSRIMRAGEAEERRVPPLTPQVSPSFVPNMVPSPMVHPLHRPPATAVGSSVPNTNLPLPGSSLDKSLPLPSLPLGAVPARHLRFTSGPEMQQSAVIDAWATESPLSSFNNYPAEDRDVAGVTAIRPPVIIGSVTAMELQALPPNAEICFGGWLYVSLQDEQERLRKSLRRYAAQQRRRAAKAASTDAMRFSTRSSSAPRSGSRQSRQRRCGDHTSASGVDETDREGGSSGVNANDTTNRVSGATASPTQDEASPNSASVEMKAADGGEERVPPTDKFSFRPSETAVYHDPLSSPLPQAADSEGDGGEAVHEARSDGPDAVLDRPTVPTKSSSSANIGPAAASLEKNWNGTANASLSDTPTPSREPMRTDHENEAVEKPHEEDAMNSTIAGAGAKQRPTPTPTPLGDGMLREPLDTTPVRLQASRSVTVSPQRTPSRMRPRSSSVPPSPMLGSSNNGPAMPPPLRHAGRYAREAMEADTLNSTWLPYAYVIVAVPMYECSLVSTTFHTALTRHKAVSLNLGSAQSRQAYGVGCITGVRYGGVMVIEYRDKIDDEEDAAWIGELMRVGRAAQQGENGDGAENNDGDGGGSGNVDLSVSAVFRHIHHSAAHRARAEKLRRVKSRIWHKLRRQGLHVVLAATRMADRRHRQHRASVASEVGYLFSTTHTDAAAAAAGSATMAGSSHTPQHLSATVRRTPPTLPYLPSSTANARQTRLRATRSSVTEPVRAENAGVEEGGLGADYGGGGAEELNEAMEDAAANDFDSTDSNLSTNSDSDNDRNAGNRHSRFSSERRHSTATEGRGSSAGGGEYGGGSAHGRIRSSHTNKIGQWWRSSWGRRRHRRRRASGGSESELATGNSGHDGRGHHHHQHQHQNHHGVTTREDRLRWADPQMADDFYLRGTFRQIGGIKYLGVVSLMDGCPVSELVQGIKRWVLNLFAMPIKARPICLYLQRYEGIAASLRVMQTPLAATALALNVASGKQLAQGNFSFHIPSAGVPEGEGTAMNMDDVAASFASQLPGDPFLDPVATSSALVNVSFSALQAPLPQPTRALGYQSYYCGPLEPEVRAVLSPEIEAMIASCQTRQLPDVLKSPTSEGVAAEDHGSAITDDPLSPHPRKLASGKHSTITANSHNTHPATAQGGTAKVAATPTAPSSAFTPAVDTAGSNHSAASLSPKLIPAQPPFDMPYCVDVSTQLAQQRQQKKPQNPASSSPKNFSLHPSVALTESATALTHPQLKAASPAGSFGAPSADAKTTGTMETDTTASHARPPANTVPTTITEFLLYDDPTNRDGGTGSSFTAANSQALAAAAAALMLRENVKGPAAVSNASLAAPSVNTGSFPAIHAPGDDPLLEAAHGVNGGSFDHVKILRETATAAMHHNNNSDNSFLSVSDSTARVDTTAVVASPTRSASKVKEPQEKGQPEPGHPGKSPQSPTQEEKGSGTSTHTYSKREGAPGSPAISSQLLPAARACNRSEPGSSDEEDGSHSKSDGEDATRDNEADERELEWQLADRELRALKSELDEMSHLASVARSELLERLEEFIQLGAVFLPHTRPDQVGLCLITMKMLRQYPEEVPVKEIHTDWVPLLMSLLTSSRESLFCSSGYDGGDLGRMVCGPPGFLTTYNNMVDAADMCDANKRREVCGMRTTKYTIDPLPPLPAPHRLHDIVIAPQPVRFTKAMLHDMKRVGMECEGLSFSFSGGSLGVLAGVLYYYSDFLRAKYRSEVVAAGGRPRDAGATVLDVLSRGGYNVLLRRIWIWGVTPESKKSKRQSAVAATKKLLKRKLDIGDDGSGGDSTPPTPLHANEHEHVATNTTGVGGDSVRFVGRPFRGTEAYALYDAIAHYLRTIEELCTEHRGNSSMAPHAPVKRRSVLMAWRRSRDSEPANANGGAGTTAANRRSTTGDTQINGLDSLLEDASGALDLVPTFEVCVATNYYYKRVMDEAHRSARSHTPSGGGNGGSNGHDESSVMEKPYCGGEEAIKKDALQRNTTKKFFGFLSDHLEQWLARYSEDKTTNAYGKRISVSLN